MSIAYFSSFSIFIALGVLALKTLSASMTGSLGLWSDAIESVVNVLTAVITLVAVWYAQKPADRRHPYGHGKVEYFAAVFQGVMIIVAAIAILFASYKAFKMPHRFTLDKIAITVSIVASILNGVWARVLMRQNSPALKSDGIHLMSDVWSTLGVLIGVFASFYLNIPLLDPLIACLVAVFILYSGFKVLDTSLNGLMDEAGSPEETKELSQIITQNKDEALEFHDLRHRNAGNMRFIEFHLVVSGDMSVLKSHEICDKIEQALRIKDANALITIHVEPEHKAKIHKNQ